MDEKEVVNWSSLFLLETTGDSDAITKLYEADLDVADEDAESCSSGVQDYGYVSDDIGQVHDEDSCIDDNENDEKEEEEEEEGVLSSNLCVDSSMESMSETEKSRLFWEACLAS
ncbi:hypothetical protein NMG60_11034919 [Bertholletia excelsa]